MRPRSASNDSVAVALHEAFLAVGHARHPARAAVFADDTNQDLGLARAAVGLGTGRGDARGDADRGPTARAVIFAAAILRRLRRIGGAIDRRLGRALRLRA